MKTYLLASLLLFFLLVDTSVSPPIRIFNQPSVKEIGRHFDFINKPSVKERWLHFIEKGVETAKELVEVGLKQLKNNFDSLHPPPPGALPVKIRNLHLVKEYLYNYGYIQYSDNFTDYLDQEAISALKRYQRFFNLTETGTPGNKTIQQMSFLRCGVPDMNFTYDLSTNNKLSWPLGTQWFLNRTNLTYGFLPASEVPQDMIKVFRRSFERWSDAIRVLNLTETTYDAANIKIGFYNFSGAMIGVAVGGSIIGMEGAGNDSHAENVTFGAMLLDGGIYWVVPTDNLTSWSWEDGEVDLETVAMHQIGHLLGLRHSPRNDSVMYPSILPSQQRKVQLSDDDKDQIQRVYVPSGSGRVTTLFGSSWGLLTAFWLGFACMVLSY